MVTLILPAHLRTLAHVQGDVQLDVEGEATIGTVLDAVEARYPMLRGTIRDHATLKRRPFVRFFACGRDVSFQAPTDPLPDAISNGSEPFMIVGAIAGG